MVIDTNMMSKSRTVPQRFRRVTLGQSDRSQAVGLGIPVVVRDQSKVGQHLIVRSRPPQQHREQ
jgi:hypothetical protein